MPFRFTPLPGQAIADMNGSGIFQSMWHIQHADGTYVGSLITFSADQAPAGTVIGGAGAFSGVTGEYRRDRTTPFVANRAASTSEDPANRRIHPGGKGRYVFHLYPRFRPEVEMTRSGPAIFHSSDFSLVTTAKPAQPGEHLIVRATGLGPTRPDLEPVGSRRFGRDPIEVINSPVEVTVNGKAADVTNQIGWPGEFSVYRVDFRVPADTAPGTAAIRITAAWIPGGEASIPVR